MSNPSKIPSFVKKKETIYKTRIRIRGIRKKLSSHFFKILKKFLTKEGQLGFYEIQALNSIITGFDDDAEVQDHPNHPCMLRVTILWPQGRISSYKDDLARGQCWRKDVQHRDRGKETLRCIW